MTFCDKSILAPYCDRDDCGPCGEARMTCCQHEKVGQFVCVDMGSYPASAICEDCHMTIPITWKPSWPGKEKPSEWISKRTQQKRDALVQEGLKRGESAAYLVGAKDNMPCWIESIVEYLDSYAR